MSIQSIHLLYGLYYSIFHSIPSYSVLSDHMSLKLILLLQRSYNIYIYIGYEKVDIIARLHPLRALLGLQRAPRAELAVSSQQLLSEGDKALRECRNHAKDHVSSLPMASKQGFSMSIYRFELILHEFTRSYVILIDFT